MGRPRTDAMGGEVQKRRRRKKDPNKPKRATTAYFYFLQHCRDELTKAGRTITRVGEFTKACSERWKQLTDDERRPFEELALKDRNRYDKEMDVFKPPRDPAMPRRPQSAYFLFLADFRKEMKDAQIPHKEIIRQAGQRWQQMGDADKQPYQEKAEQERQKYEQSMIVYRQGSTSAGAGMSAAGGGGGGAPQQNHAANGGAEALRQPVNTMMMQQPQQQHLMQQQQQHMTMMQQQGPQNPAMSSMAAMAGMAAKEGHE